MFTDRPLPEFESPPIDELVLGVDFEPLINWKAPYAGAFWQTIRDEYPDCDVQPPIIRQDQNSFPFRIAMDPSLTRFWLLDSTKNQLLQIQPNIFFRNWRRLTGDEVYPRYKTLRPEFERDWDRFCLFLKKNNFSKPDITRCEITYINAILKGDGWESFSDLKNVSPLWSGATSEGFLPKPESGAVNLQYIMQDNQNVLNVSLSHALRMRDGQEIFKLELSAYGKPASSSITDIVKWMDNSRDHIVRAFADLTTPTMHKIWKRKQ